MKKQLPLLFLWVFLLIPCRIFSLHILISDKDKTTSVGYQCEYSIDKTGSASLSQMSRSHFETFHQKNLNFGLTPDTYWFRFQLSNATAENHLLLQLSYAHLDSIEIFTMGKDSVVHRQTGGDLYPLSQRQISNQHFCFRLPIPSSTSAWVYIRIHTTSSLQAPVTISTEPTMVQHIQQQNLLYGLYYGVMLVMILYNLFIFFSLRDIRYIFYSISIFFSLLFFLVFNGHAAWLIWPDSIQWNQVSVHFAMGMLTTTTSLFASNFLELRRYARRFNYIMIANMVAGLFVVGSLYILPIPLLTRISTFLILFNTLCLVTSGFVAWRRGNKAARLFVYAWIVYLLGALLLILRNLGMIPATAFTSNIANIGSMAEVVLLSLALADKYRIIRLERESAREELLRVQRDANIVLEKKVSDRTRELQQQTEKAESLLLNIFPVEIAEELKASGKSLARRHEHVTVMFTDFVNFTRFSENMSPESLVSELDAYFGKFDEIITRHGLEKIKTIGDAYLCAGGIPTYDPDHAIKVVAAAIEIRDTVQRWREKRESKNLPAFQLRIGIHSGPVVAGVVGTRKFAWDIWGDTVNIAARVEQEGQPGRINISRATWELIQEKYTCTPRGLVHAKNKGEVEMYFVD
ncbi:MAG: hypothetical protein JNL57_09440 [Bacteroidetes bacterium]|nr:hypothetical protein [Bacteroidota bacterium]